MKMLTLSTFKRITDTAPVVHECSVEDWGRKMTRHAVRHEKDGPLYSPALWEEGRRRGNEGIQSVTAVVMDFDGADVTPEAFKAVLVGKCALWHSTHNNRPGIPKWRLVMPLSRPVSPDEWPSVHRGALRLLEAESLVDPTCKEIARAYFAPSCLPEYECDAFSGYSDGELLRPEELVEYTREVQPAPAAFSDSVVKLAKNTGGRPGDDFNNNGTWEAILAPNGWTRVFTRGEVDYWQKPGGKGREHHATTNYAGTDLFYCFTPLARPIPEGKALSKFSVYALLNHSGDYGEASKALLSRERSNSTQAQEEPSRIIIRCTEVVPIPLMREILPPEPFPLHVLPGNMRNAAQRMTEVIQAPLPLTCQSLLASVTLVAQPHIEVEIDGRISPVSNNFLTIGESGERKSATDREANRVIQNRQRQDYNRAVSGKVELEAAQMAWDSTRRRIQNNKELSYEEIKVELEALGERPTTAGVMKYTEEPSYEGLVRSFLEENYSMGLFSSEGGRFFGGFAMSADQVVKTICGLSNIWDGDHISRTRGGDGNILIYGVRLSVHLMIQPILADRVFSDPLLSGQGFLSRCCCCFPESTIGDRIYCEVNLSGDQSMIPYHSMMEQINSVPYPLGAKGMGLNPRRLNFSPEAKRIWIAFHDHVEALQREGQPLRSIKGFASKSAEHASRLAGVLAFFDNPDLGEIGAEHAEAGIELSQYYIGEALRLFDSATTNPDLLLAETVVGWAKHPDRGGLIALVDLYQYGPNKVRSKATAQKIISILEEHNQIKRIDGGTKVNGTFRRDVWRVVNG
jgi:hypothetical protein